MTTAILETSLESEEKRVGRPFKSDAELDMRYTPSKERLPTPLSSVIRSSSSVLR